MKISIIGGAGTLGSAIAYELGNIEGIREICLVDVNKELAKNHVMDMSGAFPRKNYVIGEYGNITESDIIIITAGVPNRNDVSSRNEFLEGNLKLMKDFGANIKRYSPSSLIVTISNPVDILNFYLYKYFNFNKNQLLGYTLNDSLRLESTVRKVLKLSPKDNVYSPVIGEHGDHQVPLFSQLKINDQPKVISEQLKTKIQKEIQNWFFDFNNLNVNRTTGWMTARGVGDLIKKLISLKTFQTIGSTIMSGEYGVKNISLGNLITIENMKINKITEADIDKKEKEKIKQASIKIEQLKEVF